MKCAKFGFKSGNILIAALLYLLLKEPSYGYLLVEKLEEVDIDPAFVPYGVVYRLLREMESDNLISSVWKISESGPSRRMYSITSEGVEYLRRWTNNAQNNLKIMGKLIFNINNELQTKESKKREVNVMKYCFTADESNGLESVLSYHFGHCPYYVIVEMEGNRVKNVDSMPNPLADEHNPGDLPSFMKDRGIDVIVTGGMGPKAQQYFADYGIKTITGAYGRIKDVLKEYLESEIVIENQSTKNYDGEVEIEEAHEEGEIDKLKKENVDLRRQIADLKSRLTKLEKRLGD